MRVIRRFGNKLERNPTDPLLESNGFWWELRAGDINHPIGKGKWFEPPYFKRVFHKFVSLPILPFISWRIGKWSGYAGFKIYGVDADVYKFYMEPSEVYCGSQAMHVSIRPFAKVE
jgi:hypothetical protein